MTNENEQRREAVPRTVRGLVRTLAGQINENPALSIRKTVGNYFGKSTWEQYSVGLEEYKVSSRQETFPQILDEIGPPNCYYVSVVRDGKGKIVLQSHSFVGGRNLFHLLANAHYRKEGRK